MSYTKGPLRISGPSQGPGPDDSGNYAIIEPGGIIIGEAFHRVGEDAYRDAEANARLWASAPDLLAERDALREALEATLKELETHHFAGDVKENERCPVCKVIKQVRAALGAAEEAA